MKLWLITYLPMKEKGLVQWVFRGSEEDLEAYLDKNHSCRCSDCKNVSWWKSAQACEYLVEEIEGYIQ